MFFVRIILFVCFFFFLLCTESSLKVNKTQSLNGGRTVSGVLNGWLLKKNKKKNLNMSNDEEPAFRETEGRGSGATLKAFPHYFPPLSRSCTFSLLLEF